MNECKSGQCYEGQCTAGRVDDLVLYGGLTFIILIVTIMTIVICVMKHNKERRFPTGTSAASSHYSKRVSDC